MKLKVKIIAKHKKEKNGRLHLETLNEEDLMLLAKIFYHGLEKEVKELIAKEEEEGDYQTENDIYIEKIEL